MASKTLQQTNKTSAQSSLCHGVLSASLCQPHYGFCRLSALGNFLKPGHPRAPQGLVPGRSPFAQHLLAFFKPPMVVPEADVISQAPLILIDSQFRSRCSVSMHRSCSSSYLHPGNSPALGSYAHVWGHRGIPENCWLS